MDVRTATEIATRAHQFISKISDILTDEPEFAATKISDLFASDGTQLAADAELLNAS
ncbi:MULTISPECIES: hypothetical protein [Microbacterium]|uniref:hypothetical protein n=1 Tax=Microbacterium TaxID=33882 RepID=UPI00034E99CD|nr:MULTISPECIES: hypothetical protein [Microbacterium]EPD84179.1 hypothetical protein HMPREF1529_02219 [Microbacterium sp. oral taxon 186 str. F0373]